MRILLVTLLCWASISYAAPAACIDLFSGFRNEVSKKVSKVNASQSSVGIEYARVKLLKKAGFSIFADINQFSRKEIEKLQKYVRKLLKDPLPAVISPEGDYFIIDGHHDLYSVVLAKMDLEDVKVNLEIVKDYTFGGYDMAAFEADLIAREWTYDSFVKQKHRSIDEMMDSPQRSLVGLAFMRISERYGVRLIGKNFTPMVQFKLIDLMKKKNLYTFDNKLDINTIEDFMSAVLDNQATVQFLVEALRPEADAALQTFLRSRLNAF